MVKLLYFFVFCICKILLAYCIDVKRSLTIKTASYSGAKSDQLLLAQAFIDVIGARLNTEVENLFTLILIFNLRKKMTSFVSAFKNFSNICA